MEFQTPRGICDLMTTMIQDGVKSVLEPTPGEGNLVQSLENYGYNVTAPDNFWAIKGNFDCVVMNPPFSPMEQGYKILYACMEMSENIIALMPWLTIINSKKRTKNIIDFGLVSVTHLPRDIFPGSRVQTCILKMAKGYSDGAGLLFI